MNESPIVFIDSGIGGLPYLVHLKPLMPRETFIYIADNKNFPYGSRSKESVTELVLTLVKTLSQMCHPKLIVIACNTASVTALDEVRREFDIPIVGVVPAVKTASEVTKNKRIGVLATERTANGEYLIDLINRFAGGQEVVRVAGGNIVDFVEKEYYISEREDREAVLAPSVSLFKEAGVDSVVLGCTHFLHIAKEIEELLGEEVQVIDSRAGVSRQVMKIIKERELEADIKKEDSFYLTEITEAEENYKFLAARAGLDFKGVLDPC